MTCITLNHCLKAVRESITICEKERSVLNKIHWHCEIRFDLFGSFQRGIRLLVFTLRIILHGELEQVSGVITVAEWQGLHMGDFIHVHC